MTTFREGYQAGYRAGQRDARAAGPSVGPSPAPPFGERRAAPRGPLDLDAIAERLSGRVAVSLAELVHDARDLHGLVGRLILALAPVAALAVLDVEGLETDHPAQLADQLGYRLVPARMLWTLAGAAREAASPAPPASADDPDGGTALDGGTA